MNLKMTVYRCQGTAASIGIGALFLAILIIGNAILDDVVFCDAIHDMDSKITAKDWHVGVGGQALNTAITLANMGHLVFFYGAIGNDPPGDTLRAAMDRAGVRALAPVQSGARSQTATILVQREHGSRLIVMRRDAALELPTIDPRLLDEFDIEAVFSDGYEVDSSLWAARIARERESPFFLDVEYAIPRLSELVPFCDTLFVSASGEDAALPVAARAPCTVIVKMGANGARSLGAEGELHEAAREIDPVDTTGAGDAFDAGYIAARLRGHDLAARLDFACRAGAAACMEVGGQMSVAAARAIGAEISGKALAAEAN
jgi:sugar/nucleoside kinase (ribokinase family)